MDRTPPEHTSTLHSDSAFSIMIVAGEASGDKHGASLAKALTQLHPDTNLFGSGGTEMRAAGVETLVDARDVAIIGVPEIARAFGKLYRAYRTLLNAARSRRPAVVVLIDWPDFNMRLARKLHREGFKIVYYISPQVWAWRKYRFREKPVSKSNTLDIHLRMLCARLVRVMSSANGTASIQRDRSLPCFPAADIRRFITICR